MLLIIDKDEVVRRLCGAVLACSGYPVLLAANPSEGIDLCKRFSSKMRLAILGENVKSTLCEDLRRVVPALRCLLIKRNPKAVDAESALRPPFPPAELLRRVASLYGNPEPDPSVYDLTSDDAVAAGMKARLASIPSVFSRLTYLVTCRILASAPLQSRMRDLHRRTFEDWLSLSLHSQQADYEAHLRSGLGRSLGEPGIEDLVPEQTPDFQRQLFVTDIHLLKRLSK